MGLINDYITDIHLSDETLEKRRIEPFWRQVKELEISVCRIVEHKLHFPPRHTGMNGQSLDSPGGKILHLVLHKRDKRSDYQRDPFLHKSRDLKADGLSASCGENGKHVLAAAGSIYDFTLHRPERIITPIFLEYI